MPVVPNAHDRRRIQRTIHDRFDNPAHAIALIGASLGLLTALPSLKAEITAVPIFDTVRPLLLGITALLSIGLLAQLLYFPARIWITYRDTDHLDDRIITTIAECCIATPPCLCMIVAVLYIAL